MSPASEHGGRHGLYLAAAATVVLTVTGVGLVVAASPWRDTTELRTSETGSAPDAAAPPPAPAATATPKPSGSPAEAPVVRDVDFGPVLSSSTPVSLDIPSIDVHSDRLVDLAYDQDGALEVPTDFDLPGWFSPGPTPGQFGPAVIAGHVDSKKRPAVFYRLRELRPGAKVEVGRKDGSTATFTVDKVEKYPKNRFPTSKVYGNSTSRAELRLITCGGSFDRRSGHYRDNIVAYAHLTA